MGKIPVVNSEQIDNLEKTLVLEKWRCYHEAVEARQIQEATAAAHDLIVFSNRRIEEFKPWTMAKDPNKAAELNELLYELLEILRHVTLMLSPILIETTEKIKTDLFPNVPIKYWQSFNDGGSWGLLEIGTDLGKQPLILFPKREV